MLSAAERRGKKQLELKAWNSVTKLRVSLQCSTLAGADVFQCSDGVDSRFPRPGPGLWKSLSGCDRNSGAGYFLFLNFGTVVSFLKAKSTTKQALPTALLLRIRRPEFLPDPGCKLCQHTIQSELRYLPFSKIPYSLPSLHFCSCSLLYPGMPSSGSSPVKITIFSISE